MSMLDLRDVTVRFTELERLTRDYLREDPVAKAKASIEVAMSEFDVWSEKASADLVREGEGLSDMFKAIEALSDQIDAMASKLERDKDDPRRAESVQREDDVLRQHNALVQRHNNLATAYKQKEAAHNARIAQFNQEAEQRHGRLELIETTARNAVDAYQRWITEEGLHDFAQELNTTYAALMQEARLRNHPEELQDLVDRARHMRMILGTYAREQHDCVEGGFHMVRATLCRSEDCTLLVDCGASITTITPEMVDALDMRGQLGEKVKIMLPNAIRVEAPQLAIPVIAVEETEADYVKAVVLKSSMPGVDGCLGLSFLDRFDYIIDKRSLRLRPARRAEHDPRFDVFISHRSDDLSSAKTVFDFLVSSGYKPFLSEVSMGAYHTTEFQKAIDAALECAEHLIVVGSARAHFESPWVEAEWRLFESHKRAGKKQGNIIPVLCSTLVVDDLPFALGRYQCISIQNPNWKRTLIDYLPRGQASYEGP